MNLLLALVALGAAPDLEREPSVEAVVAAVTAPLDEHLDAATSAESRSRWAHALPQRLGVRLRTDDATTFDKQSSDDGWSVKNRDGQRLVWQVDVMWNLSNLAFDPRSTRLHELRAALAHRRLEARDRVVRLYFERRRHQRLFLQLDDPGRRAALWIDIAELTARIDAMTDGLLSRANVTWWTP